MSEFLCCALCFCVISGIWQGILFFSFYFRYTYYSGKEFYGITWIHALSGTWGEKVDGAIFQAHKFDFLSNIPGELYSGFVLLLESKLDDDVGNIELELYLVSKKVKSSVSFCGQVHLDEEQVHTAAC